MVYTSKTLKFNKIHKKKRNSTPLRFYYLKASFGFFIVKALEYMRITSKHLEAFKKEFHKLVRQRGKLWFNASPTIPITKKNEKSRMGKGVGKFYQSVYYIYPGQVLLEFELLATPLSLIFSIFKK